METYSYSAKNNAFYANSLRDSYIDWPKDAKEVTEDIFVKFNQPPPDGQRRISDHKGLPTWEVLPPPTEEDQIAAVTQKKWDLIRQANDFINMRQWPGKAAIGRLTGDALQQYNYWLDYLDALETIDPSAYLDVSWPVEPYI